MWGSINFMKRNTRFILPNFSLKKVVIPAILMGLYFSREKDLLSYKKMISHSSSSRSKANSDPLWRSKAKMSLSDRYE